MIPRLRQFWVVLHRWAGLSLAFFLVVTGATGAILPFYPELDRLTAPAFHVAARGAPLAPIELRNRAEASTGGQINYLPLHLHSGEAAVLAVQARPGQPPLGFDEVAVDPVTGREQGRRTWGDIGEGSVNLMPFVYRLHYTLALDSWGVWILGFAALIWTIDCFVGWYLTLPVARRAWWPRWRKAWGLRTAPRAKVEFDLHRASGLWLWPILLLFAWSSVGFNLPTIYSPVMKAMLGEDKAGYVDLPRLDAPVETPALDWTAALATARMLTAGAATERGFVVTEEAYLRLDRGRGVYYYGFRSDRDVYDKTAGAALAFDANTGAQKYLSLPTGQHVRSTFETWLFGLHLAAIGGLPVRIAVSVIGAAIMLLSATGILIWLRKREARRAVAPRRRRLRANPSEFAPAE